jgi:hypothetical protein
MNKQLKENALATTAEGLPAYCFYRNLMDKSVIRLVRGMSGYYPVYPQPSVDITIDLLNEHLGVTKPQAEAMYIGSMFGWHVRGADPANYTEDGKPIHTKK